MSKLIKGNDVKITRECLEDMIGELVHVPVNMQERLNPDTSEIEMVNMWFSGTVAGYQEQVSYFDFEKEEMVESKSVKYSILLTDGYVYSVVDSCIIKKITQEEFIEMIKKEQEKQRVSENKSSLILPK